MLQGFTLLFNAPLPQCVAPSEALPVAQKQLLAAVQQTGALQCRSLHLHHHKGLPGWDEMSRGVTVPKWDTHGEHVATEEVLCLMQDCHGTATVPESQMPFGEKKKKQQQKNQQTKKQPNKNPKLVVSRCFEAGPAQAALTQRTRDRSSGGSANLTQQLRSSGTFFGDESPLPPHVPWRRFVGAGVQCQPGRLSAASHLAGSTACQHAQRHRSHPGTI